MGGPPAAACYHLLPPAAKFLWDNMLFSQKMDQTKYNLINISFSISISTVFSLSVVISFVDHGGPPSNAIHSLGESTLRRRQGLLKVCALINEIPRSLGTTWPKSDEQILTLMDDEYKHVKTKSLLPFF